MWWVLNAKPQLHYPREIDKESFLHDAGWAQIEKTDGKTRIRFPQKQKKIYQGTTWYIRVSQA
jgi:hypothetical protein